LLNYMRGTYNSINDIFVQFPWGHVVKVGLTPTDLTTEPSWLARTVYYRDDTNTFALITPVSIVYSFSGSGAIDFSFTGFSGGTNILFTWLVPIGTTQIMNSDNINILFKWTVNPVTPESTKAKSQFGKLEALTTAPEKDITGVLVDAGEPHEDTVGENIMSLRSLLKRYTYYTWTTTIPVPAGIGENFTSMCLFDPFGFVGDINHGGDSSGTDYISYVAPLYRFFKGEMRFKVIVQNETTREVLNTSLSVFMLNNYNESTFPSVGHLNYSRLMFQQNLEGIVEFTVPYYNRNHSSIIGDVRDLSLLSPIGSRIMIACTEPPANPIRVTIYRSFGENATFGYLLSAPTLNGVLKATA